MKKHTFIKIAAATAVGVLALTGCSGGGGGGADVEIAPITNPVAGEVAEGTLDGVTFTFAGDGGTTQEGMMAAYLTPFAAASGAKLNEDSPQTLAKIQSQVDSGNIQWDMISSYGDAIARECGTLFEKLDMSKIDTSKVPQNLLGGTECGVPSISYAYLMVFNNDSYGTDGPKDWNDFFDTKKFPGTRTMYSGDGKIDGASVQAGAMASGWDPASEEWSTEWAEKGLDKIESIKEDIVFYGTGAQAQQMLESGEAKIGAVWNGRAVAAARNGAEITPVWNDWFVMIDYFAIVKGTKKAEAAYYAINYAYGPDQQAKWVEETAYSPLNTDAKPNIDEITETYLSSGDEKAKTSVDLQLAFWSDLDVVKPLQDRWASLVAGA